MVKENPSTMSKVEFLTVDENSTVFPEWSCFDTDSIYSDGKLWRSFLSWTFSTDLYVNAPGRGTTVSTVEGIDVSTVSTVEGIDASTTVSTIEGIDASELWDSKVEIEPIWFVDMGSELWEAKADFANMDG